MPFLKREHTVLAVVDLQERLLGAFAEERRAQVVRYASICVEMATILDIPIVVTEQYPKGLGPTIAEVRERVGSTFAPIEKIVFSCGRSPEFNTALAATGKTDVLICGVETHVCVLQTVLDLVGTDYRVHVRPHAV
jgi:isochorismate hydrolase